MNFQTQSQGKRKLIILAVMHYNTSSEMFESGGK